MDEGNGFRGGLFSNLSPGILGLEMPIQPPKQQQQQQNQQHQHMVAFARQEPQLHMKQPSEEEEGGKRKAGSQWHRMKWTDNMVRMLIMAVYYIGDECGSEATNSSTDAGRKKASLMQKKGKWKSVSKAMMEKGFCVSPQQCEDKFNDLNKRYKRVNEILGKGTACKVVENQSLLDRMDHLSAKSKEEVSKLLNSKHLFFREMCAYHNSCAGNGHHDTTETQQIHNHVNSSHDTADNNPTDDDDSDEEEEEGEEEEPEQLQGKRREVNQEANGMTSSLLETMAALRGLENEVGEVIEDVRRSGWEKKKWMEMRMVRVEEERVGKEEEGLEIEKERLKWVKYCGKKEREMERKKLRNERAKLECDRMLLILKHKEVEMNNRAAEPPSSVTGC